MEESKFETLISVISSMWDDKKALSLSDENLKVLFHQLDLYVEYGHRMRNTYYDKSNEKDIASKYRTDIYIERIDVLTGFIETFFF